MTDTLTRATRPPEIITAGEAMAVAMPELGRRLRHATSLSLGAGGAELNVAIAAARLGVSTGWISRVGADELGQVVLSRTRAEGVDVSRVVVDESSPTGLYLRERFGERVRAHYMRRGSAASLLGPADVDPAYLGSAQVLHVSGIAPALSRSSRAFTVELVRCARELDVRVSFDVNYRSKLWGTADARRFCEQLLPQVDTLFVSDEEALLLWDRADLGLAKELLDAGPRQVLLKLGANGAVFVDAAGSTEVPAFAVPVVDTVGAGDAFAAGYLTAELWGADADMRLRTAAALGAYAVMTIGDYEGLPDRDELDHFLTRQGSDQR